MVATAPVERTAGDRPRSRPRRAVLAFWIRHIAMQSEAFLLPALIAICVVIGVFAHFHNVWVTPSMVVLPLLLGGFLLRFTAQLVLLVVSALVVILDAVTTHPERPTPGTILLIGATALIVLVMSRERVRLGVRGTRGESMLFDLRERLYAQGRVPRLPPDWHTELALKSAGGQSFAGDFLIAARTDVSLTDEEKQPGRLQLGLVDVSGKGLQAGTRALLLSGAFGGLLGSVPVPQFLTAANRYLLRQGWDEGFATAVHVVIDLATGEYECYSAGHPPIAQLDAGSGTWSLAQTPGPVLGVLPEAEYKPTRGRLGYGDGLMLFTDGLIELPGRDLSVGLDRLLGVAGTLQTKGFAGGAARVIDAVARKTNDDRALVLVWRTRPTD
ncbi:MAG TPA: PP2C family protein-serine/threonine phosphatase [Actinocrinis sp.]|uniref:PP2C family protein-serine/threonine phosphatase n=1 Tax=Actinocrinis sp. TaxID=1920516 RepID=UPI002DDCF6AA|nr:PP2C family protein-serine/threonine phosphatase [Actinocrinis sp.]HEV2345449.1 PP2C family protein-serine/threonine phosphatase [Actinocrinis sp.]